MREVIQITGDVFTDSIVTGVGADMDVYNIDLGYTSGAHEYRDQ